MTDENTTNSDNGNTDIWAKIHATLDRITERQEKTDAQMAETSRQMAETDRKMAETDRKMAKTDEQMAKTDEQMAKTDKKISALGSQYGGLHKKFGSFTEDLARPSIARILEEDFEADYAGDIDVWHLKEVGPLQVDAWGIARNGARAIYLVEIKSKYRPKHIRQVRSHVEKFREYYPQFKDYGVLSVIAVVEADKDERDEIWDAGIYVIEAADGVFRLGDVPKGFLPDGLQDMDEHHRDVPLVYMLPGKLIGKK